MKIIYTILIFTVLAITCTKVQNEKADLGFLTFLIRLRNNTLATNSIAGITISATSGLQTSESGNTATFTMVLNTQPTANVTIPISSSNTAEGTLSPASIIFTSANWNIPQVVIVFGVNDFVQDGNISYKILTGVATSADANYNGLDPLDVDAVNQDNDSPGMTVSGISGNTTESGGTATFTIVLNLQPTANVTIPISSSNTAEGTVSPASLIFTSANWNIPQFVTVTGVNDAGYDGDISYQINFGASISSDSDYSNRILTPVSVVNLDNEVYFLVGAVSGNTSEGGAPAAFNIRLNVAPSGANTVTIPISSSNTGEGIVVSAASIVFTNANFNIDQGISINGVDDNIADGDTVYSIITGLAVSGDLRFNGRNPDDVSLMNQDGGEKRTFVTSLTYDGNLGGSTGADAKCNADPSRPGIMPNTYKAFLGHTGMRRATNTANTSVMPLDWVLAANTRYFRSDGTTEIFISDANRIFVFGTLTNSFGTGNAWTGLNGDWTNNANQCTNWSSNSSGVNGQFGNMNVNTSSSISSGIVACDQQQSILCIQQ